MEKNAKIIWTEPAKKDLKYIFDFISEFYIKHPWLINQRHRRMIREFQEMQLL